MDIIEAVESAIRTQVRPIAPLLKYAEVSFFQLCYTCELARQAFFNFFCTFIMLNLMALFILT
jgi:hypothetical protein